MREGQVPTFKRKKGYIKEAIIIQRGQDQNLPFEPYSDIGTTT
jgi:hypothetical protein